MVVITMRINDKESYENISNSISMSNLRKILDSKKISTVKLAMNANVSDSTINAYLKNGSGKKIPSLPTLISIADYLNCSIDYLLDRSDNPMINSDVNLINNDKDLNQLMQNITSLPKEKRELVIAYVQGLLNK